MRLVPMMAAAVLAGTALLVVQAPAATAATACTVDWTANQWSSGFTADVQVTNGGAPVTSWTLGWSFDGDQRVTNAWNATVAQA